MDTYVNFDLTRWMSIHDLHLPKMIFVITPEQYIPDLVKAKRCDNLCDTSIFVNEILNSARTFDENIAHLR